MRHDPILVDFLGLAGVGKSELSRRVGSLLEARQVPVRQPSYEIAHGIGALERKVRKSFHVACEIASHPIAAFRAGRAIASSGQSSTTTMLRLVFNWLLVTALTRRARRTSGVHLFDQGLAQAVWSVALDGSANAAVSLLSQLPWGGAFADLLVIVEADLSTVEQRLHSRSDGASRLDRRWAAEPELLARGAALLEQVSAAIAAKAGEIHDARVIVITNEAREDLEREASELAAILERRFMGGALPPRSGYSA